MSCTSWTMRSVAIALTILLTLPQGKAKQLDLDLALSNPTMLAGEKKVNYLKVKITGFELEQESERQPVNIAIVLDRSGSMNGSKLQQAKEAAVSAIQRLSDADIASVVAYDDGVEVLVPATKLTDREAVLEKIWAIQADGSTALFGGVSKGAAEVRKFLSDDRVNRVILLSDGIANVGPSSPSELEQLGASLLKEGVAVSTLGLGAGYNEDLMRSLAAASTGNHVFIERADDLANVFNNEFDDILSVVANQIRVEVKLDERVRPVRVLNSDADIEGQTVHLALNQVYAKQERYFIIEVEVDSMDTGEKFELATATMNYSNMIVNANETVASSTSVAFTNQAERVAADLDAETFAFCTVQLAVERNRKATALRDAGQIEEAKAQFEFNTRELLQCQQICESKNYSWAELGYSVQFSKQQAEEVSNESRWQFNRKALNDFDNSVIQQQTYDSRGKKGK